ncbi:unnamed protein product, partial [Mesorhabditis spiculigera]
MTAVINPRPSSSSDLPVDNLPKPDLLSKVENVSVRILDVWMLKDEDGFWTAGEDKSLRLYLRREAGDKYWPSINEPMVMQPTCLHYDEQKRLLVVTDDMNSVRELRRFTVHSGPVSSLHLDPARGIVFSCSRDKTIMWHNSNEGNRLGSTSIDASAVSMIVADPFIFVGDYSGNIHVLRIDGTQAQHLNKLSAHTGTVTSLAWDHEKQWLFSGSADNLVIMWDVGGKKGDAYELTGHTSRISRICYSQEKKKLFTADESGKMMVWAMAATRIVTPAWANSDYCQLCDAPFFWNLQAMWQKKVVGQRQHHCRICGQAACSNCCTERTTYPPMGFEIPVRICKNCENNKREHPERFDLTPLAVPYELKTGVVAMHLANGHGKMVVVGQNKKIFVYNVSPVL